MVGVTHISDYQVAQVFGPTLSLIYKYKMAEINEELAPIYAHLDSLDLPKYTDTERAFARRTLPSRATMLLSSIDHINKIRRIYRKVKNMPAGESVLNVEGAKAVKIETLYNFKYRGRLVSCPFHSPDKTPSMSLRNNRFHCFACSASGDTIAFIMRINNMTFKEAVEFLCQK